MTDPTSFVQIKPALLVTAVTGGVVAAIRARGPWPARLFAGIGGALVSYFLAPIVAPIAEAAMETAVRAAFNVSLDLDPPSVLGAVGFLLGVFGMEILQFIADVLRGERSLADALFWRAKKAAPPPAT